MANGGKNIAFTLAEVIIVMGIIGILAEITIPMLVANIQQQVQITKLQKTYSVLSQAYNMIQADAGGQFVNSLSNDTYTLQNVFKDKLSYTKSCDSTNLSDCFPTYSMSKFLNMTASNNWYFAGLTGALTLSDGTSLGFHLDSYLCKTIRGSGSYSSCGYIMLDENGTRPPNTWGKDIYLFFIFSDKIYSSTVDNVGVVSSDDCNAGSNYGFTCASKFLQNQST